MGGSFLFGVIRLGLGLNFKSNLFYYSNGTNTAIIITTYTLSVFIYILFFFLFLNKYYFNYIDL